MQHLLNILMKIKMKKHRYNSQIEEFNRLSSLLEGINNFVYKHRNVTYIEFDYYVVHDMILFSIEPNFDFEKLDHSVQHIKKSLPAVKRIFKKPIIFLKDTEDVLPVENTRIINQNTMLHLANHAQNIANITKKGIKPRKLLTRIYEDEYGLYENIIFCNYVDEIIRMVKKNRKILNSIFYTSNILRLNLLEKGNHINYFLALGKLHTGYIRDFNQYYNLSKEMLYELSMINKSIKPRLFRPVYKNNKKRNKKLALKKTNIFLKQKDYRMVYKTYKFLLGNQTKNQTEKESVDIDLLKRNYLMYVRILTIFAAGHFNFQTDEACKMNLELLNIDFSFKGWKLNIINNKKEELLLTITKDKTYRILLISFMNDINTLESYKMDKRLDEVVVVKHFDEDNIEGNDVYISVEDIDSFRRIQQIILRGMIYADTKRDICPFCGGKLEKDSYHDFYQCNECMIQIKENVCDETGESYFYTDSIPQKKHTINHADIEDEDKWFYRKQIESSLYFRNITKINENNEIICPICNKIHEKQF